MTLAATSWGASSRITPLWHARRRNPGSSGSRPHGRVHHWCTIGTTTRWQRRSWATRERWRSFSSTRLGWCCWHRPVSCVPMARWTRCETTRWRASALRYYGRPRAFRGQLLLCAHCTVIDRVACVAACPLVEAAVQRSTSPYMHGRVCQRSCLGIRARGLMCMSSWLCQCRHDVKPCPSDTASCNSLTWPRPRPS